jgi:hypothetical protein
MALISPVFSSDLQFTKSSDVKIMAENKYKFLMFNGLVEVKLLVFVVWFC